MEKIQQLLEKNKVWVAQKTSEDKNYFSRLSGDQKPSYLWIGCSDSRIPAEQITNTEPGEIFVHRNIANMVIHTDMSMLSVLDYAVNVLEIQHVIVCGHYGCGGVLAAMTHREIGLIDNWVRHIKDVYRYHKDELNLIEDIKARHDRFVELNVVEQVYDLAKTSIIQDSWRRRKRPIIHGWVYDISSGLIKDLDISMDTNEVIASVVQF